ncbi:hypothetical protein A1O1_02811 [Capronia coronata CBS 617.96]|uniref:Uncharacterized protein n=1 Tax=Capronia coronata CBS 617.96 TaxID=1182541 RepID=W9YNE2_9EURO|nr:uncharacterized protein A1O1_02811 [Capronia coronata CBS 617.96]EXJ94417.1 hypothetical protein A1O1_02811 [Capronia coronata CBS 617.96]
MPATTRSKTKQSSLDDFQTTDTTTASPPFDSPRTRRDESRFSKSAGSKPRASATTTKTKKDSASDKRKQPTKGTKDEGQGPPSAKRRKQKQEPESAVEQDQRQNQLTKSGEVTSASNTETSDRKPIIINRAPVLQLWSSCVAHKLYPHLSWPTCFAIGSAISTLCAISKGRSIGVMEKPDTADEELKEHKEAQERRDEAGADEEILVMGFRLMIKNGDVLLQGKPRHGNEGPLKAKFGGDEDYIRVKDAMDHALASWTAGEEAKKELNKRAFHMYESFRPSVQSGQGGWGRKGELSIEKINEVVERK